MPYQVDSVPVDHSYFKPYFGHLTDLAQVIYLDLREHGRSARHGPAGWNFEVCADDLRAFCDAVGILRPVVLGHSMGGCHQHLRGGDIATRHHQDHDRGRDSSTADPDTGHDRMYVHRRISMIDERTRVTVRSDRVATEADVRS
jgi:pimeloyl-ACP methyl ester carboxylesterase